MNNGSNPLGTQPARGQQDVYLELVRQFPLRPIRSEKVLDRAIRVIDTLLDKDKLTRAEQDYLEVLGDLTERYESEHHPPEPVPDADMLRHLMEARQVSQSDLARATGIAISTISEVLSGKRKLNRRQIGKLASYFAVKPHVFAFD
ncbi:MAG TPA: helix-turn-helix domain-containing protein [Gemmataceae bacterium]|nr:helix-turn-helix domain-containing protein [Gemmataceae bacterium]